MNTSKIVYNGKRKGFVVAALVAAGTLGMVSGSAEAVTLSLGVPAHAGHAFSLGNAGCFASPSFSNAVQNICGSGQAWLIPVTNAPPSIFTSRTVSFFVGAKNIGGNVPHCRAIDRALNDSNGSIGADINITSTNTSIGSAFVGPQDTLHADCFFPAAPTNQLTNFRVEWFQTAFGG